MLFGHPQWRPFQLQQHDYTIKSTSISSQLWYYVTCCYNHGTLGPKLSTKTDIRTINTEAFDVVAKRVARRELKHQINLLQMSVLMIVPTWSSIQSTMMALRMIRSCGVFLNDWWIAARGCWSQWSHGNRCRFQMFHWLLLPLTGAKIFPMMVGLFLNWHWIWWFGPAQLRLRVGKLNEMAKSKASLRDTENQGFDQGKLLWKHKRSML